MSMRLLGACFILAACLCVLASSTAMGATRAGCPCREDGNSCERNIGEQVTVKVKCTATLTGIGNCAASKALSITREITNGTEAKLAAKTGVLPKFAELTTGTKDTFDKAGGINECGKGSKELRLAGVLGCESGVNGESKSGLIETMRKPPRHASSCVPIGSHTLARFAEYDQGRRTNEGRALCVRSDGDTCK
jgi:hypothetical protein